MTRLQELLIAASSAANGANSATLRAAACRTIDGLGEEWTATLSTETGLLVTAIASSVRALAGATSDEARAAVASAIALLVTAARVRRVEIVNRPSHSEPRRYWIEADQ